MSPRWNAATGLPEGLIQGTVLQPDRLRAAVTGRFSYDEWLEDAAEALGGTDSARAAIATWSAHRGTVQPEVLAMVRELRGTGVPVVIVSNATDRLPADLDQLGLREEVDEVVNSSRLGYAKPSPEFFRASCTAAGVEPERCLFVDDDPRHVRGARAAGLVALRYTGPADLRYVQAAVRAPV